ncbi:MAG: ribosomal protein S18-alanine N-acetyltransferase [Eubacterium sp.]|nr:ribosomal protein S18-alanine N-acetyltransferase [Eubacterium sp.]
MEAVNRLEDATNVTIAAMTASHVEAVAEIESKLFSTPWSGQAFADALRMDNVLFYTALADGEVAGYCGIYLAADEGEITNVAVAPFFRRRGIATALLGQTMEQAHKRGAQQIFLEVRSRNDPAIRLYEKAGFATIGIRKKYYQKPQDDALVMMFQYADK